MIIIGQNMREVFTDRKLKGLLLHTTKYDKLEVWDIRNVEYEDLLKISDRDWREYHFNSWWRTGGTVLNQDNTKKFKVMGKDMTGFIGMNSQYELEEYWSITHWFNDYIGLSTTTNLALLIFDLAKLNNMSEIEFLKSFEF